MLCRHKKKYTGGYKLDVYGKGICKNIVFKQNTHSTDVNASSDYWLYTHTHTPLARTQTELLFLGVCVWDIIMLIMTIIYEIKF